MNKETLIKLCEEHGIILNEKSVGKFDTFFNFLVQENAKYNLTAITNYEDVLEKHFYDSLSILFDNKLEGSTVDIGCGGGFPGMPLAIVDPDIKLTCLDATNKKITYINELAKLLDLNVETIVARSEEYKANFDNVIARGVASLNVLLEIVSNLVKPGGKVIAMKGSKYKEELDQAKNAIKILGYKLEKVTEFSLPSDNSIHANLVFTKIKSHDNKYPRNYAQIKKKPL